MKKQLAIWQLINKSLTQNVPVMLLYVLESKGSSPGRQGFFMAVNINGEMQGSIGGGVMENKFVKMAKDKLLQEEAELSVRLQFHDKVAAKNQSGMICSGEQTILIYRLLQQENNYIDDLISSLQKGENGLLQFSPQGLFFSATAPESNYSFSFESDNNWLYKEKTGYKNHLHIVGAGHCSLPLSAIMHTMDFYIHLYDDRQNLPTFSANTFAHKKLVVQDYNELTDLLHSGSNQYVVVMTVGYRTDDAVVRILLQKQFKYFGLLGSKKKIEKMFSDYKNEGIDEALLKRIHAPLGLPISSQTPEEIAISIAAQIIQVKNEVK